MTRWGLLLLVMYLGLGLSPLGSRRAARLAVGATLVVISSVFLKVGGV